MQLLLRIEWRVHFAAYTVAETQRFLICIEEKSPTDLILFLESWSWLWTDGKRNRVFYASCFIRRQRHWENTRNKKTKTIVLSLLLLLYTTTILCTGGRGVWLWWSEIRKSWNAEGAMADWPWSRGAKDAALRRRRLRGGGNGDGMEGGYSAPRPTIGVM